VSILGDFGLYVVRGLALVASWLASATAPAPWPVVVAAVALPVVWVLRFVIWVLRGTVWPVRCKHPVTTKRQGGDSACRATVSGEWRYCRDHNRAAVNYRGQRIDPDLPRWKTVVDGKVVDRSDVSGAGDGVSLLFYRGFARRPSQVLAAFPDMWAQRRAAVVDVVARLRRRGASVPAPAAVGAVGRGPGPSQEERDRYRGVAVRAERADQALATLRVALPVALLLTAGSAAVPGPIRVVVEYAALLALWVCVEVGRRGLWQPAGDGDWRRQVVRSSARAVAVMAGVAVVCALLDAYVMPFLSRVLAAGTT
jgi:hypothetical protein